LTIDQFARPAAGAPRHLVFAWVYSSMLNKCIF
jgi:hypothetical protein